MKIKVLSNNVCGRMDKDKGFVSIFRLLGVGLNADDTVSLITELQIMMFSESNEGQLNDYCH